MSSEMPNPTANPTQRMVCSLIAASDQAKASANRIDTIAHRDRRFCPATCPNIVPPKLFGPTVSIGGRMGAEYQPEGLLIRPQSVGQITSWNHATAYYIGPPNEFGGGLQAS